jgi:hypothetical protein
MVKQIINLLQSILKSAPVPAEKPQDMSGIMIHGVTYNSQRDNFTFAGKFKAWSQCFSTCAYMLISYFAMLDGKDDKILAEYVDDVETMVGKPGIGEQVIRKFKWITGFTSLWWLTQKYGIEKWLWARGLKGSAEFIDKTKDWQAVIDALKISPVILGTNKLGNLPGGHIILLTGYRKGAFIVNDPFGDATTDYAVHDGYAIVYGLDLLQKHAGAKPRFMYWRPL